MIKWMETTHMKTDPHHHLPQSNQFSASPFLLTSSKRHTFVSSVYLCSLLNHSYSLKRLPNTHIRGTMNACGDPLNLLTLNEEEKLPLKPQSSVWVGVCERAFVCVYGERCHSCFFKLLMHMFTCFNFLHSAKCFIWNLVVFDCMKNGLIILFQLISQVRGWIKRDEIKT